MYIGFVRPPSSSYYNDTHVREDHQITYAIGYARHKKLNIQYKVFDFPLQRDISINDIIKENFDAVIVSARETGSSIHYARRIANSIKNTKVILYGQVSRLSKLPDRDNFYLVETNEKRLFDLLFDKEQISLIHHQPHLNFRPVPYIYDLNLPQSSMSRFKAALESTRGCQFKCKFCYINFRENEAEKWIKRSNKDVLADIDLYYKKGVRSFIFMDSEFFGHDSELHSKRKLLLKELSVQYPGISYMVYTRADTMYKFGNFELLKKSGLYNVLIGVESFASNDLRLMKKGQKGESLESTIFNLLDADINITLSLITFNRSTTVSSLQSNLDVLRRLHNHKNAHGLGMPNFVFNLEASWNKAEPKSYYLTDKTYVKWLMFYKDQPIGQKVVVDNSLEPLMEAYRVILYEVASQVSMMCSDESIAESSVLLWYKSVGLFVIESMQKFLDEFTSGLLDLENLPIKVAYWYKYIRYFNKITRSGVDPTPITEAETLSCYDGGVFYYQDHGWDKFIPLRSNAVKSFLGS